MPDEEPIIMKENETIGKAAKQQVSQRQKMLIQKRPKVKL